MFGMRLPELLVILVLVLVVFGASKIPQLGAGLGQGLRSFKKAFGGEPESEPEAKPAPHLPPPDKGPPPPGA
jgi:sec-independent protein translocase protein TatA